MVLSQTQGQAVVVKGVFTSTVDRLLKWSRSHSLWYYSIHTGCCADEVFQTTGARYDLERFGCLPQSDPLQSDLLILSGAINRKSSEAIRGIYHSMLAPKYVIAVGACACSGGVFREGGNEPDEAGVVGVPELIPVDILVPGCPPRPEAIMDGLIRLQEKIRGQRRSRSKAYFAARV